MIVTIRPGDDIVQNKDYDTGNRKCSAIARSTEVCTNNGSIISTARLIAHNHTRYFLNSSFGPAPPGDIPVTSLTFCAGKVMVNILCKTNCDHVQLKEI